MPYRKKKLSQELSIAAYKRLDRYLNINGDAFEIYGDGSRFFRVTSEQEAAEVAVDLEKAYRKFKQNRRDIRPLFFCAGSFDANYGLVFLYAEDHYDKRVSQRSNRAFFRSDFLKDFKAFIKLHCPLEKRVKSPSNQSSSVERNASTSALIAESKVPQQESPRVAATTGQIQKQLQQSSPLPPLPPGSPPRLFIHIPESPRPALTYTESSTQTVRAFFLYSQLQAILATQAQLHREELSRRRP